VLEICNNHEKAIVGVDRMAASPSLSSVKSRDRARKEHLDRIVKVIQYTKSASWALELPNMNLPLVHDSTVVVIAEEEVTLSHIQQQNNGCSPNYTNADWCTDNCATSECTY
jgi:hypothetical protein